MPQPQVMGENAEDLLQALLELIRRAATDLPPDVEEALGAAKARETCGSAAERALGTILDSVARARQMSRPICQDTGVPIFHIRHPRSADTRWLKAEVEAAIAKATRLACLRPNALDSVTGENSGTNIGVGFPTVHFEQWDEGHLRIDLLLKGGGSENVSAQCALPRADLRAGRDLDGVRKVVLDTVYRAQGKGCAPGVLGIAIGGDRGSAYAHAMAQLLRPLPDANPSPALAALEERLFLECNGLGIGPMGFGGRTTVLGVKVGALHRLPACYFVTVSYMCWACRRANWDARRGFAVPEQPGAGTAEVSRWPATS